MFFLVLKYVIIKCKYRPQDSSAGKGTALVLKPELDSWNPPEGGQKESTLQRCL